MLGSRGNSALPAGRIMISARKWVACTAAVVLGLTGAVLAQSAADFYKARNVDLYIGFSVGGAYDLYARVLGRHIGAHIPGAPTLVPKNMEGAGSLRLANYLYRVAPQDGSAFATFARGIAFDPLLIGKGDAFDAQKFNWLGSANNEVSVCVVLKGSGVTRFEDMFSKEVTVGGTGTSADTDQFPRVINGVLGTHFKIVDGYPGGNDVVLAMERGEVQGPLRLVVVERLVDAQSMARREKDAGPGAAVAGQASRPARRALDHGFCQDRRAAGDPENGIRPQRHGPALCRAAEPAGGARGDAAPGVHGHHDG
jgi:hypothetical protein